jgi:uncharacterized RDD family membrane protein YckC
VFCTTCGAALPEGAAFCARCGTPVRTAAAPMTSGAPADPAAAPPSFVPADPAPHAAPRAVAISPPPFRYGGFWRRFVARVIDALILGILFFPIQIMLHVPMIGWIRPDDLSMDDIFTMMNAAAFSWMISGIIDWLYFALMESSPRQATLGKMALNIKVTDLQGRRISFLRATGRHFSKILSTVILLIGYLMAAFTERKQALHDMIAGTLVVRRGDGE